MIVDPVLMSFRARQISKNKKQIKNQTGEKRSYIYCSGADNDDRRVQKRSN